MMNSMSDHIKQFRRLSSSKGRADAFEPTTKNDDIEAKKLAALVEWMNSILPNLNLPAKASFEELRTCLLDGTVLLQILNRLRPGSVIEEGGYNRSAESGAEKAKKFLACVDELGILPRFELSDLQKGSMKPVVDCLLTLRAHFMHVGDNFSSASTFSRSGSGSSRGLISPPSADQRWKVSPDSRYQHALRSPVISEPSPPLMHNNGGNKFHEVFQLKQGRYADLSAAKISEMMKSNSLDNAPTQSLLSVVNGILDESVERKNGELPQRVASLLRRVVQEIERRISTQAEHLRTQNNLFKAREEKYQSRIRVLETLASGTIEEAGIVMDKIQKIQIEKGKVEEKKKNEDEDIIVKLMKEKEQTALEISALKKEIELAKKTHELRCIQIETESKSAKAGLEARVKELEGLLEESRKKLEALEAHSESSLQSWSEKENVFQRFVEFQFGALRGLRSSSKAIKHEIMKVQKSYLEEFNHLGTKFKSLTEATQNYHLVLTENRKLFNELQDLKGNIRVYCRARPFLPGQDAKSTTIEHIGENGELVITNPSKPGKDGRRMFRFNKVYGPGATQAEVFSDTQPLIRTILDGYNVCIFAYGQTGSGKTHTMTGPKGATEEDWGVNYRALNDLFKISRSRNSSFEYEVGVQMVEIYNEQVRDLLTSGSQKRLGIKSTYQSSGIAVPDATMLPVTSTSDVMEIMDIGLKNRAVSSTAMNERSSRSHSVVSIHVRGKDLHDGETMQGNLHLIDLAGSERVDRSEVTGDRLKEAQHINKSLSALGDVIYALAQKSSHIPYRNSKLTQLLQSSLGGRAKTLMFVQLNPDVISYSETLSTLKFAERVSGVELGAARSSKEGKDVKELMEQVASLKDTIEKKDEEIERLQLLKDLKNVYPLWSDEKHGTSPLRHGKGLGLNGKVASAQDNNSEYVEKHSGEDIGEDAALEDTEVLEDREDGDDDERLSDISEGGVSMGTENDGSADESLKPSDKMDKRKVASKPRSLPRPGQSLVTPSRDKGSPSIKRTASVYGTSTLNKPPRKWT